VEGNSSPDLKHSKQKPLEPPCFSPLAPHNGTAFPPAPRSARADPGRASVTRRCDTIHARTRSPGRLKNKIKPPRKTQRSRRQGERPPVFVPSLPHSPHSPLDPPPAAPLRIRRSSRAEIGSSRILLVSYPFRRLVEVGGLLSSFLEPVLVPRGIQIHLYFDSFSLTRDSRTAPCCSGLRIPFPGQALASSSASRVGGGDRAAVDGCSALWHRISQKFRGVRVNPPMPDAKPTSVSFSLPEILHVSCAFYRGASFLGRVAGAWSLTSG
jgi:hypothetical protein